MSGEREGRHFSLSPFLQSAAISPPQRETRTKKQIQTQTSLFKKQEMQHIGKIFQDFLRFWTGSRARTRRRLYFRPQDRRRSNGRNGEWSECEWEAIALSDLFKRKGRKEGGGEEEVISKGKKGKSRTNQENPEMPKKCRPLTCTRCLCPKTFSSIFFATCECAKNQECFEHYPPA